MIQSTARVPILGLLLALSWPAFGTGTMTLEATQFKPTVGTPVAAELGSLIVPERRAKKGGPIVTIKFVRFASTAKRPGAPIVYLAGGPGGSGIDAARGPRFALFMAMREFADVIALDQRGTGSSEPNLACTESARLPFDKPLDRAEAEVTIAGGMRNCMDRLRAQGIDATAYTTLESAADINDLRQALGAKTIVLWGISYGTHLALATLRAYPASIDRAILAGIEPPDSTLKLPGDQQRLLQTISDLASKDPALSKSSPDTIAAIARVLGRLREQPAAATLVHPANGQSIPVVVGAFDLQLVLASMLAGPESFADLPELVGRLDHGDWTALALQAARVRMGHLESAMAVAMDCASGSSKARRSRIAAEAASSLLGDAINFPFTGICSGLNIADLGEEFRETVRSEVPLLLISGSLDGRTPEHNASTVAAAMPNAQRLLINGAGHSDPLFLSSPKILEAMQRFMRGKAQRGTTISVPVTPFIAPRVPIALDDDVLKRYAGSYRINGEDVRKVVKAGSMLFTIRGDGAPYPLRPTSETAFFWEGQTGGVRFEVSKDGKAIGMYVDDGSGKEGPRSDRMD